MHANTSVFLDLTRLLAALIVFLGHASGMNWTGGFLWQLGPYMDTCVMVFFVLSGFVIAHVVETRDASWQKYAANRAARIWSVALPALALTFVIDWFGVRAAPELYIGQPWFHADMAWLRYLASSLMVHDYWQLGLVPGVNGPFWSLSYEAAYYLWFGVIFYARGPLKWPVLALLMAAAGPLMVIMFATWLMGVAAYRWSKRTSIAVLHAVLLLLAGAALLTLGTYASSQSWSSLIMMDSPLGSRLLTSAGFALLLVGVTRIAPALPTLPQRHVKRITWCAAPTFALYLFHRPLIQLFSYLGPEEASSWARRLLVILGTLIVVYLLSPGCDRFKRWLSARIETLITTSGRPQGRLLG